jgi:hypothetical protein
MNIVIFTTIAILWMNVAIGMMPLMDSVLALTVPTPLGPLPLLGRPPPGPGIGGLPNVKFILTVLHTNIVISMTNVMIATPVNCGMMLLMANALNALSLNLNVNTMMIVLEASIVTTIINVSLATFANIIKILWMEIVNVVVILTMSALKMNIVMRLVNAGNAPLVLITKTRLMVNALNVLIALMNVWTMPIVPLMVLNTAMRGPTAGHVRRVITSTTPLMENALPALMVPLGAGAPRTLGMTSLLVARQLLPLSSPTRTVWLKCALKSMPVNTAQAFLW